MEATRNEIIVRKYATITEEVIFEGARQLPEPLRLAAALAVVKNPFAGGLETDISILSNVYSAKLGPVLADRARDALGARVRVFGKAALVGLQGETQHGSSIIHTRLFGDALRRVGEGGAPVTAAEKRGPAGSTLDVSLRSVDDPGTLEEGIVSHLFSWAVSLPDAPMPDEIVVIAAVGSGPRPHSISK